MLKLLNLNVFLVLVFTSTQVLGATITEDSLVDLAKKGAPQLDQINAAFYSAAIQQGQLNERFAPEFFAKGSYAETNERPILSFFPIWSPVKQGQIGLRKELTKGFTAQAAFTADQRTAVTPFSGRLENITTTALSFTLQMDLWKDLFGRMTDSQINSMAAQSKRAEFEKKIQTRAFIISVRRIFWSLVANQESLKVSEELLKSAQTQAQETNARFRNAVAESDEVARNEAQVSSRKGALLYLQYERETLLKQLKNLLPELNSDEIQLGNYDLQAAFNNVMACAGTISSDTKIPYQNTHFDETIQLLREIKRNSNIINSKYASADVKLFGTVKATGVGSDEVKTGLTRGSYASAFDDVTNNNRSGYEVGLNVVLPLGEVKQQTQNSKELYDQKRLDAAIASSEAQVVSTHQEIVRSVGLLNQAIVAQKITTEQLKKRLLVMRKKYEQARASINEIINDQDALLNSELSTIQTRLQLINLLFDYLMIYTETPCPFNRI
jgi:outer membrane protein TolC